MNLFVVLKDFGGTDVVAVCTTYEKAADLRDQDRAQNPHQANPRYWISEVTADTLMYKPDEFLSDYRVRWTAPLRAEIYHMRAGERQEDEPQGSPVARLKVLTYAGPVQYEVTALTEGQPDRTETILSSDIDTFLDQRWWERG